MNAVFRAPVPGGSKRPWKSPTIVRQFPFGPDRQNKTIQSTGGPQHSGPATLRPGIGRAANLFQKDWHIPANSPRPRLLNPAVVDATLWRVAAAPPEPASSTDALRFDTPEFRRSGHKHRLHRFLGQRFIATAEH